MPRSAVNRVSAAIAGAPTFGSHSYDAWWMTQDETPSYQRYAKVIKLIGANDPDKRWLLKNPGHIWQIDAPA
jgi:hypothetical protein